MAKEKSRKRLCPFCRRDDGNFRAFVSASRGVLCEHCVARGLVSIVCREAPFLEDFSPADSGPNLLETAEGHEPRAIAETPETNCLFCEEEQSSISQSYAQGKLIICLKCLCAAQKTLDEQYFISAAVQSRLPLSPPQVNDHLANMALRVSLTGFVIGQAVTARVIEPVAHGYKVALRGPMIDDGETFLVRGIVYTSAALDVGQNISLTCVGVHKGEILLSTFSQRGLPDKN